MDAFLLVVLFLLLLYLGGVVATVMVARSRGRSTWYVLWPVFLGKIGAIVAIAVILLQPEKAARPQESEKEGRTQTRTPPPSPWRALPGARSRQVRMYQRWTDHQRSCATCRDGATRCPHGASLYAAYVDTGGRLP